jgi:hypothetical protein
MRQHFMLPEGREFLAQAKQLGVGAFRVVPGLPCPAQALMIRDLGFSWPIAVTMEMPACDRTCREILVWNAGTLLAEQQAQWLSRILQPHVGVTIASGDMEDFRSKYSDQKYDAIWITTHGEFDHNDPHRSGLKLSETLTLTFDQLRSMPVPTGGRRLLILDACDSGAVPVYGGLSDLGFGPLMASKTQATISHRWPIEQFASAMFNALLALGLRSTSPYLAYEFAVSTMIRGKESIADELRAVLGDDHDLIRRIRNNESVRWNTLAIWGSAAFFE